jgi:hypothetical protein
MTGAVSLRLGARFVFDGDLVEVTGLEGSRITVRDGQDRWRTLSVTGFLTRAVVVDAAAGAGRDASALVPRLAALTPAERVELAERAGHVREVLTGYRSGFAGVVLPGEPREQYSAGRSLRARQEDKARELGVSDRTVRRWVGSYRREAKRVWSTPGG